MSWQNVLKGNSLEWLLEPEDPGVRYLALRDLCDLPVHDPALQAASRLAHSKGPIATVLAEMNPSGFWSEPGPGYRPKYRSTVWSIITLAQLGASIEGDERIQRACEYLVDNALTENGQFSTSGTPSTTIDCLQGNMCWALRELGYDDPRLEIAFEWMARTVTGEGIAPKEEKHALVRYYAYQCGPNFACGANYEQSCAWGAAKVMGAFGALPKDRRTPLINRAIQVGVDFLLSTDPARAGYPSGYSEKPSGNWRKFGFPVFYVTDFLQIVEVLVRLGYGRDPRLVNALQAIKDKGDRDGRWNLEYSYTGKTWIDFGAKKAPNKWITLRVLRVLKAVG